MQYSGAITAAEQKFQSAPAPRGGRCNGYSGLTPSVICFNPRPPRGAGDAGASDRTSRGPLVSIRARPEGRAMLGRCDRPTDQHGVSIRARPEGRAMPTVPCVPCVPCFCFNPRPPRGAGDALAPAPSRCC